MSEDTKSAASFDLIERGLIEWRSNKTGRMSRGIPDEIWLQIFSLESKSCPSNRLRSFFNLNSEQYKKKYAELMSPISRPAASPTKLTEVPETRAAAHFSEISVKNKNIPPLTECGRKTKATIKELKSIKTAPENYLDPTTIIVECIRKDGHRLKIHTTNQSVDAIIQSFYRQDDLS